MTPKQAELLMLSALAAAMLAGLALATNWRLALVAALAAGAIALTRLRYAPVVAVALLAFTLVFALAGYTAASEDRHGVVRSSDR
jgi:asparagine N-glycosylation enzyme membrane subunit Stt3